MKAIESQDLGDVTVTIRPQDKAGPTGVESLIPDDNGSHIDALEEIRSIIDENYGNHIDSISDDGENVLIERLTLPSDDLPHIEYRIIEE